MDSTQRGPKDQDEFGGTIAYGMFDEFGYNEARIRAESAESAQGK